jgi:hypothetical protein
VLRLSCVVKHARLVAAELGDLQGHNIPAAAAAAAARELTAQRKQQ